MAIEHILTDIDTVHNLAYRYNVPWTTIVTYNSLEYPYIVDSKDAYNLLYASGYLKVTRALFTSALTFYKGSQFATKIDNQGIRKIYELVQDTTIPAGDASGYLLVRCVNFGTFGNAIAEVINQPHKLNTSLGEFISALIITNEQPFTNGTDATVKITGQAIFIPTSEEDTDEVVTTSNINNYLNELGGEDFSLTLDGDLSDDGFGDIATAVGLENIKQSVMHRLMTERGSLAHRAEYGTGLALLIGRAQAPYITKLMELDIEESLSYDDRISAVVFNAVDIVGTSVYTDISLTISGQNINMAFTLNFAGGANDV